VLELYEDYPNNRELFEEKRPEQKSYETALEMPALENPDRFAGETTRMSCIHCHNIHDAENFHAYETGAMTDDVIFRYPYPDNVGLSIDPASGVRVAEVLDGSPAARAEFEAGEDIVTMNGQAITSIADMQWVLHHIPAAGGEVTIVGSRSGEHTLSLEEGWKNYDISWRASMWSMSPRFHVWMPELPAERQRELRIPEGETALEVRWINQDQESGRAAREAGLREGDIVVELNGEPIDMAPPQFMAYIKLNFEVGDELTLTVLREGRRREVVVPLVH
jgi:membrane-associated protease RseP (regulator of RpoE activity)